MDIKNVVILSKYERVLFASYTESVLDGWTWPEELTSSISCTLPQINPATAGLDDTKVLTTSEKL